MNYELCYLSAQPSVILSILCSVVVSLQLSTDIFKLQRNLVASYLILVVLPRDQYLHRRSYLPMRKCRVCWKALRVGERDNATPSSLPHRRQKLRSGNVTKHSMAATVRCYLIVGGSVWLTYNQKQVEQVQRNDPQKLNCEQFSQGLSTKILVLKNFQRYGTSPHKFPNYTTFIQDNNRMHKRPHNTQSTRRCPPKYANMKISASSPPHISIQTWLGSSGINLHRGGWTRSCDMCKRIHAVSLWRFLY